ncbi:MAG TPA: hypothetical protein VGL03_06810 [Thermoanaerobaculia bacterium]
MNRRRSSIRAVSLAAIVAVSLVPLRALQEPKGESDDPSVDPEGRVGPYARFVLSLAVDPLAPGTIYAGTGGGVFKSSDRGASWSPFRPELSAVSVGAVVLERTVPPTVHLGTGVGIYALRPPRQATGKWMLQKGLTAVFVDCLVMDPASASTIYAGTGNGVFKSTDGGATWTASVSGLSNLLVTSLALDTRSPSTLYAGTNGGGVFRSTDGARTWTLASGSAFRNRSYRQGSRIDVGSLASPIVLALAIDPSQPETVYAGTSDGLFKSSNGGTSWSKASSGMRSTFVLALAVDPFTPSTLYAGTASGVVKSSDRGASWMAAVTGLTNSFVTTLAIDPTSPSRIYAGTDAGIFVSLDAAETWKPLTLGWGNGQ